MATINLTLGRLKQEIQSLGFADDSDMEEYQTVVTDAINRATQTIFDDIVKLCESTYKRDLTDWTTDPVVEWEAVRPALIDINTLDSFEIELPENTLELVPLLCAYFVWLEDNASLATYYWNAFDQKRERLIASMKNSVKGQIQGGYAF